VIIWEGKRGNSHEIFEGIIPSLDKVKKIQTFQMVNSGIQTKYLCRANMLTQKHNKSQQLHKGEG
jgi:hypothetical protein